MKKLLVLFILLFAVTGCADKNFYYCPYVVIKRDSAYLTQKNNYSDDFQIEVKGFEGYCYYDERVKRNKAVITPIFEVVRLQKSEDTDVDFNFFLQTMYGPPEYLGMWAHSAHVKVPLNENIVEFKGKSVEVKIPHDNYVNFEILLGLKQSPQEIIYNKKTFDIQYRYRNFEGE